MATGCYTEARTYTIRGKFSLIRAKTHSASAIGGSEAEEAEATDAQVPCLLERRRCQSDRQEVAEFSCALTAVV